MNGRPRGSSVTLKYGMAISGLLLFGFVIAHLLGNLQLFAGRDALNSYAEKIQSLGPLIWVGRLGLLSILIVHVACAVKLTQRNKAARPVPYAVQTPLKSTFASRSMLMTGMIVLAFVVYHVLHFTVGVVQPSASEHYETIAPVLRSADVYERHDVYAMVIDGFSNPAIALSYIVAMFLLGLHLSHGVSSLFQSLGIIAPSYRALIAQGAQGVVVLIVLGNVAIPLAVLLGLVGGAR